MLSTLEMMVICSALFAAAVVVPIWAVRTDKKTYVLKKELTNENE